MLFYDKIKEMGFIVVVFFLVALVFFCISKIETVEMISKHFNIRNLLYFQSESITYMESFLHDEAMVNCVHGLNANSSFSPTKSRLFVKNNLSELEAQV